MDIFVIGLVKVFTQMNKTISFDIVFEKARYRLQWQTKTLQYKYMYFVLWINTLTQLS